MIEKKKDRLQGIVASAACECLRRYDVPETEEVLYLISVPRKQPWDMSFRVPISVLLMEDGE